MFLRITSWELKEFNWWSLLVCQWSLATACAGENRMKGQTISSSALIWTKIKVHTLLERWKIKGSTLFGLKKINLYFLDTPPWTLLGWDTLRFGWHTQNENFSICHDLWRGEIATPKKAPKCHDSRGEIAIPKKSGLSNAFNSLTAIGFWRELKNSHRTQESPPWWASAASSGADSTVNPDPTQTGRGRVVGGGVGRSDLQELINWWCIN